uniref:AraC family transcriptional regulator n=1 Tax=Escherichia coli TaxID=562 RepID=UPI001FCEE529
VSIKNDGHYFCRAGGNRPDGLNEPVTLKQQGNSVGEVADTLNFFDSFHFSKAFKHKFGYAPSAVLKNTDQHPTDASPHN